MYLQITRIWINSRGWKVRFTWQTNDIYNFKWILKNVWYTSLNDLPELPRYKLDENQQIVIDDLVENNSENEEKQEAPEPKREEQKEYSNNDEE